MFFLAMEHYKVYIYIEICLDTQSSKENNDFITTKTIKFPATDFLFISID